MTAPPQKALPERIGRYRVLARIGKGAMGSVYSALDEQLGREVAVKLMLAEFEDDPELRERFYREARITGQLAHRNIVTVFDLGEDSGCPYIVMELLDGLPLNEYLKATALSLDAKLDLMIQTCDGLQNAHEAGVVHRDLKPSNLRVTRDGVLKVLDFGVARLAGSNLTSKGMLLGTPEYMSPEQARGQKMDARADLFSAAGVFYFMLSGRPPFGARDLQKVLHAIINDPPAPLTDDEAPEALRQVLARALSKGPQDRYAQCIDMRIDLDHVRRSLTATTSRVVQAARDRYQQILGVIEERRLLGRSLGIEDIDASCDAALASMRSRFAVFADLAAPPAAIDRSVASAALETLQQRHNAEQAALAALHERAVDGMRPGPVPERSLGSFWRGLRKERE